MDDSERLARLIGERVRSLRSARRWTLDQLAAATGVSRRLLVTVEQGAANPSVGTLLKIADALGVALPALVEPPSPRPVTVTPAGSGAVLWSGRHGGRGVLVAATRTPDAFELWDWTLGAGDRHAAAAHSAGTRELLQVHEGTVEVTVAEQAHVLVVGDAVAFPGDVPHAYGNVGDATARCSLAVLEPVASGADGA